MEKENKEFLAELALRAHCEDCGKPILPEYAKCEDCAPICTYCGKVEEQCQHLNP